MKDKKSDLTDLPNIGPKIAEKLNKIGIRSKKQFLSKDPFTVFDKLRKKVDPTLCRCALASVVGAKVGATWYEITKDTAREYEKRHPRHKWGPC